MKITLPEFSMVVLIGASGSGKSTFARRHFKPTEVLSSDFFRGVIADDETDQSASGDAFEILHLLLNKRLARGQLTVIDATNVQVESRKTLLNIARQHNATATAIVFDLGEDTCHARNQTRPDRRFGPHVVRRQSQQLRHSVGRLRDEGFRGIHIVSTVEQVNMLTIERTPLLVNRSTDHGPFDIIGDIHGCLTELRSLMMVLGYHFVEKQDSDDRPTWTITHPQGRKPVFLGDLVDRGPDSPGVLRLVMGMVEVGTGLCVPGNHDAKLLKKLMGRDVNISHGLALTLEQLDQEPIAFRERVRRFIDSLPSHLVLDGGKLVVAHAGMKEDLQGRMSGRVRDFALYGETTGETDEFGLPIRFNWAGHYRGRAAVVYGHTPIAKPEWLNRTMCVDTGCVYGGMLSALRYPESELISVNAEKQYCEAKRPFLPPTEEPGTPSPELTAQQQADDVLDLADVTGHRIIPTRWSGNVTIREGQAAAALEVMSRFAANPRWLIYLPPTMSPCESSSEPGYLEYPTQAFGYYRYEEVDRVICEQKHMGSRAIVIVGRDEDAIRRAFGITNEGVGICYTRTGRRFFDNATMETEFIDRIRTALTNANFWERFQTDWFCFDGELMPWSAKAQQLLTWQYAPTGASGLAAFTALEPLLAMAPNTSEEFIQLRNHFQAKGACVRQYVESYRRYCWPVKSVDELQYAPFHMLASEGKVYIDQDHIWHMTTLAELAGNGSGLIRATPYRIVELNNDASEADALKWWLELTESGGEGMVVKPLEWGRRGKRGLVQPAVKVRGREYLRIIYGPEYTLDEHLTRLRSRALGGKRSLAVREFALGIEGLERFVRREPLRKVHECGFGVLAMESEPIDPRL